MTDGVAGEDAEAISAEDLDSIVDGKVPLF
jgi:hypothetical protein